MTIQTIIRIYAISFLTTFLMFCVFLFCNNYFDYSAWNGMKICYSRLTGVYCELDRVNDFFHQKINTYSNLVYFFLGMIVVQIALHDRNNKENPPQNLIQQFPLISFFFGCCLIYLCLASAFFHASLTWIGERADMNATYSIAITLIGISCYRLLAKQDTSSKFKNWYVLFLFLIVMVFIEIYLYTSSFVLLPLLLLVAAICTVINYFQNKERYNVYLQILSLLFLTAAFILRTLDVKKIGCDPNSVYQGHAVWHLFTGMSAFLLYWVYRSEKAN